MVAFEFPIMADLAKFSPEVGSIVDAVNSNLSMFGVPDRMGVQTQIGTMTLSTEQEPTDEEMQAMKELIRHEMSGKFPDSALTIGEPRRKSGNPSSQSNVDQ